MFPNIGKRIENSYIKNRGGFLKGSMQHLPWGDLVLLEKAFLIFPDGSRKHQLHLPGEIFRRNRALEKRTNSASTHLIYTDVYEAQRGAVHPVFNYGVRTKQRATEIGDLNTDISTLREYVVFMLRMGPHFEHVLKDLYIGMSDLAARYSWKLDENKKQATSRMIRGLIEKDSLGRKNIPAAAMSMGGAIWNLLEREENIQWLSMHMDQRAIQTERLIRAHMDLYGELWDLFGGRAATSGILVDSAHETSLPRMKMNELVSKLETVKIRTFCKNAKHTARDIRALETCLGQVPASNQRDADVKDYVIRLREGIRWVFVLDALQRDIIFPLSYLIEDLLRQERIKRRRTKSKGRVVITSDMAPEKFADIADRISEFKSKLSKCNDQILVHPVKNEVLGILAVVDGRITQDDWRLVKNDLDAIVDIL